MRALLAAVLLAFAGVALGQASEIANPDPAIVKRLKALAEELWRHLGHAASLAYEPWPAWDEALAVDDVIELPVQVNGKVRGRVQLARDASEADARAAALAADARAKRRADAATRRWRIRDDRPSSATATA